MPRIMQETSRAHLSRSRSIGFVPTMGALHEGHLSLVRRARDENDIVVVSIFVNPLQFGPAEDFDRYPRDIEGDSEKLRVQGAHILFMPDAKAVYPDRFSTSVSVGKLSEKLCGIFRPGHFDGVATVVCKLFNMVKPTRAYFGQKDFQQTVVIQRMIEDLNMDVEICVCPTVREEDGLARSSRNRYLSAQEREAATVLFRVLKAGSEMLRTGTSGPVEVAQRMHDALRAEPLVSEIQYAGVYDPDTFEELLTARQRSLLAAAVTIGSTRLIDNMVVESARR
jgi:pantoate--beta-alanine ligase